MSERDHSEWTYDILAVVVPTIQNQGDHQDERVQDATLDRVPDHASIESVHLMI